MVSPAALWRSLPSAPRPVRRIVVIETFLAYPLLNIGYFTLVATGVVPGSLWAPIAIALMALTIVGAVAIYGYSRDRANIDADLDERERQLRDRAWVISYGVLSAIVVACVAVLVVAASFNGPVTIGMDILTPVAIALGVYLALLPPAVLAWIEPDPPADDDVVASNGADHVNGATAR